MGFGYRKQNRKTLDKNNINIYIASQQYIGERAMEEYIKVMKALSDPNRVKIIKILQKRVMCVCEIRAALGLAQPTISKHLKVLEEAGLVSHSKDGLWVNYSLTDGAQSPFAASLLGQMRHWLSENPEIKRIFGRLDEIHREEICKRP
jgi:ArsR family transcriptional regulator